MNAFFTIIPLILIRFGLLSLINKDALKRAALFAPMIGIEKIAYRFYQISNLMIFIYPFFLEITTDPNWLIAGMMIYGAGILLCLGSILSFAKPERNGINLNGLYRYSRNPIYMAYFIYFLGVALLTKSLIMLAMLLVFKISSHWIILSEERWCIKNFGDDYTEYMDNVRRYI